jgi:putative glutamine amidotransferase
MKRRMHVGLSYHQNRPKDALYETFLRQASERYGVPVEPAWLAGTERPLDRAVLNRLDGIVLTGGADVEPRRYGFDDPSGLCRFVLPDRDEIEVPLVEYALERGLPILAICRGMQLLNVVRGGTLVADLPGHDWDDDARRHRVRIDPQSRLATHIARAEMGTVSSSHHQAAGRPGKGLRVVAWSEDDVAEAIEWEQPAGKPWLAAVQWHPERMALDEPLSGRLVEAFLRAVSDGTGSPRSS